LIEDEKFMGFVKRMKRKLGLWDVCMNSIPFALARG
jgi:hypothetical protein